MEEYTREQIQRADDTDLYVFLSGRGEQFKRCGKEYRWLRHDSVMINKNEWYRFSQNKGGHAIDSHTCAELSDFRNRKRWNSAICDFA